MGNEMGDLCHTNGTVATDFGTFTVQTIWDERTQACKAFSSDASKDFNVAISPNIATLALNAPMNLTVKTGVSVGAAQMLTLSASAPAGVTATVSPTTVTAGGTATLTVTATNPSVPTGLQVVVRADATTGTTVQTHTAALLVSTSTAAPVDLGPAPADLAQAPRDLADDGATDGGVGDDASSGGTGGGGGQPPPGHSGCDVVGASANASAIGGLWILMLLALARVASRRLRQHRR
jgi:hypothetical protein